jgi:translation initiation factor IF-1
MKEQTVEAAGTITAKERGGLFHVKLDDYDGADVIARVSGQMDKHRIRVEAGDRVSVELSPYDTRRGRIIRRYK